MTVSKGGFTTLHIQKYKGGGGMTEITFKNHRNTKIRLL